MKRTRWDFLHSGHAPERVAWLAMSLIAVPVFLLAWWIFLVSPSRTETLTKIDAVDVWHEPLGSVVFSSSSLESIVKSPPDWSTMKWSSSKLPSVKELGVAVDLPPDAPKQRVWFRIQLPKQATDRGRLSLLGNRVIAHGPWSIWVNRQLVQTNLVDWPIQLNVPLRVTVPLGVAESCPLRLPFSSIFSWLTLCATLGRSA